MAGHPAESAAIGFVSRRANHPHLASPRQPRFLAQPLGGGRVQPPEHIHRAVLADAMGVAGKKLITRMRIIPKVYGLSTATVVRSALLSFVTALLFIGCKSIPEPRRIYSSEEIKSGLIGNWTVNSWSPEGDPVVTIATFRPDGTFESRQTKYGGIFVWPAEFHTNSAGERVLDAMWRAENGWFLITKSNCLPTSNLGMYSVKYMDAHEVICARPSEQGRVKFERLTLDPPNPAK